MKIEKRGILITELPAGMEVETVSTGIRIDRTIYNEDQVREIRDALNIVLGEDPVSLDGPWNQLEDIPASVTEVWDRQDDHLERLGGAGGNWDTGNDDPRWSSLYGPFRARK